MYKCKYCGKEFDSIFALGGHVSHCKLNPNARTHEQMVLSNKKGRETYINQHPELYQKQEYKCICQKCGKEYSVFVTPHQFAKGEYSKYCSVSFRNFHTHPQETKDRIRENLTEKYALG